MFDLDRIDSSQDLEITELCILKSKLQSSCANNAQLRLLFWGPCRGERFIVAAT